MRRTARFQHFTFATVCRVSELREVKREIQVMPPLVLLIKFVLLLIIFQASFSFNLLSPIGDFRLNFWSPNIFSTRHGDQNGRSLEIWANIDNIANALRAHFVKRLPLVNMLIGPWSSSLILQSRKETFHF